MTNFAIEDCLKGYNNDKENDGVFIGFQKFSRCTKKIDLAMLPRRVSFDKLAVKMVLKAGMITSKDMSY